MCIEYQQLVMIYTIVQAILIFGMPHETRHGFIDLMNRSIKRGFDTVKVNNLFLMDGIELNRPDVRKKHGIKTK